MTTGARSGHYPIDRTDAREIERLEQQDAAWTAETLALLDRIGVAPGWRCLDLGCGPRGLTRALSDRVGPAGRVVGLEYNPDFVAYARRDAPANIEIVEGDAYATGLPDASFDLVHMRFLASVAGEVERLVAEAARLVRPGGVLAMQEADGATVNCYPPHPAWTRLTDAIKTLMPDVAGDYPAAHRHYRMLLQAGLIDVCYNPALVGVRACDPWHDFLPSTALAVRGALIGKGHFTDRELDATVAACRAHLADPGTVFVSPMLVQVWGRKPAP